ECRGGAHHPLAAARVLDLAARGRGGAAPLLWCGAPAAGAHLRDPAPGRGPPLWGPAHRVAGRGPRGRICTRIRLLSLTNTSLGSNWPPFLLAFTAVIEYVDCLWGQLLSFSAARTLCSYLQTSLPDFLLPEQRPRNHRRNLLFQHPPDAP